MCVSQTNTHYRGLYWTIENCAIDYTEVLQVSINESKNPTITYNFSFQIDIGFV